MVVDDYVHSSHGWLETLSVPARCGEEALGLALAEQRMQLPLGLRWPPRLADGPDRSLQGSVCPF